MNSWLHNFDACLRCSCLRFSQETSSSIMQFVTFNSLRVHLLTLLLWASVAGHIYRDTLTPERTYNFGSFQRRLFFNSSNHVPNVGSKHSKSVTHEEFTQSQLPVHQPSLLSSRFVYLNSRSGYLSPLTQSKHDSSVMYRHRNDFQRGRHRPSSRSNASDDTSGSHKILFQTSTTDSLRQRSNIGSNGVDGMVPAVTMAPTTYTELTDEGLLQVYRARSPCFTTKLQWVRDRHNCSIFFVCARHRVAAVLTCPGTEVWSNRVTNCVPARSRWDDCTARKGDSVHSRRGIDDKAPSTTTGLPTTPSSPNDNYYVDNADKLHQRAKPSNERHNSRNHNRRISDRDQHFEKGSQQLDNSNPSRQRGDTVNTVHSSSKRKLRIPTSSREDTEHTLSRNARMGAKHARSRSHYFNRLKQQWEIVRNKDLDTQVRGTQSWLSSSHGKEIHNVSLPPTVSPKIDNVAPRRRHRFNKLGHNLHRQQENVNGKAGMKVEKDFYYKIEAKKPAENDNMFNFGKVREQTEQNTTPSGNVQGANPDHSGDNWLVELVTLAHPETTTKELPEQTTTPQPSTAGPTADPKREGNTTHLPYLPECGVSVTSMIVGGSPARQGRWPWVVSLQLSWARRHVCGATLVHAQWVVTAAHCVAGPDFNAADEWRAVFWQHGSSQSVDHIVKHPDFVNGDNYPNDIALLRLSEPADVTGFDVRHACLPVRDKQQKEWDECWIMGWGEAKDNVDTELKELEVDIRRNSECSARWGWKRILNSHVCVGNGDRGACNGDSGGPLICRQNGYHYLAGVTSWGVSGCQTMGYPSVFTRVAYYTDWIQNIIDTLSK